MNPWSKDGGDETLERDLFARRARALPPAPVPSLAAVMRAADAGRSRADRGMPAGRVVMGLCLAAASFAATVSGLPRVPSGPSAPVAVRAAADGDAGASSSRAREIAADPSLECVEDKEASTCRSDLRFASIDVGACFGPAPTFTAYDPPGAQICKYEALASVER